MSNRNGKWVLYVYIYYVLYIHICKYILCIIYTHIKIYNISVCLADPESPEMSLVKSALPWYSFCFSELLLHLLNAKGIASIASEDFPGSCSSDKITQGIFYILCIDTLPC